MEDIRLFEGDVVELLNVTPGKQQHASDGWVVGNRFVVDSQLDFGSDDPFISVKGFRIYLHTGQWMLYKRPLRNWAKSLINK